MFTDCVVSTHCLEYQSLSFTCYFHIQSNGMTQQAIFSPFAPCDLATSFRIWSCQYMQFSNREMFKLEDLPFLKLTVRPCKQGFPKGKDCLPTAIFRGLHPWKLTWNLEIPELKRNIQEHHFPNLHFWVSAADFPGCILVLGSLQFTIVLVGFWSWIFPLGGLTGFVEHFCCWFCCVKSIHSCIYIFIYYYIFIHWLMYNVLIYVLSEWTSIIVSTGVAWCIWIIYCALCLIYLYGCGMMYLLQLVFAHGCQFLQLAPCRFGLLYDIIPNEDFWWSRGRSEGSVVSSSSDQGYV